jgi:dTDP-4-amino-4,6-dideoxygalactose transaminase
MALEKKLEQAAKLNRLPKVIIPVHLTGQPADMMRIHSLAEEYGFKIIEDASHATGATYRESQIGDGKYSDITVFSFHPVKIITTGEGGISLTNSPELASRMRKLRSHGITRDKEDFTIKSQASFYYEQQELGFNYRITDFQAALGISQLSRIDEFIARRQEIADYYDKKFSALPITKPFQEEHSKSSWHLYVIRVGEVGNPEIRNRIFEDLKAKSIGVNLHYIPVYQHPYYQQFGYNPKDFPQSEAYYSQAISLPMYPDLTKDEQDYVIETVTELVS